MYLPNIKIRIIECREFIASVSGVPVGITAEMKKQRNQNCTQNSCINYDCNGEQHPHVTSDEQAINPLSAFQKSVLTLALIPKRHIEYNLDLLGQ
jgi:hypothetical protein